MRQRPDSIRVCRNGDRIRSVDILAPAVLDPENAYTLLDAFNFDSEKARVREDFNGAGDRFHDGTRAHMSPQMRRRDSSP